MKMKISEGWDKEKQKHHGSREDTMIATIELERQTVRWRRDKPNEQRRMDTGEYGRYKHRLTAAVRSSSLHYRRRLKFTDVPASRRMVLQPNLF